MSTATLGDASWLTTGATARVLQLLNGDGEEARAVGGAVRNALMKLPVGEIDIATTAVPDEVVRRARAAGIKSVPTGIDHGTVTLVVDSTPFEVTTLREDTETFGRHARVSFGRDWLGDANRRDFTINALSVGPDGVVHDYVGGLADIAARRVRFIGEASKTDRGRLFAHPAFLPHACRLRCGRGGSRRLSRLHRRPRGTCDAVGRTGADGDAQAAGRRRRRRRHRGDGRQRLAADDRRRRHLWRTVRGDDRGRARARPEAGCDAPARRARRSPSPRTPRGSRRGCGSPMPKPRRSTPWAIAGGGLPAWTRRAPGGGCIGWAKSPIATACCSPGRARAAIAGAGPNWRGCRSAGPRRNSR